ncbi:hypothetical protein [Candidatus Xianfuyuplasma coldseepsis]|uniref:HNH endonuclease n=1 Tax=Candidatus Xianfuyuplasma coldseepsis TaxID=2782163 RepID=A0A7L7KS12_9MOLU|nr:hypothetical protein [Xianfuyuplasma coldseepsis]QMS85507.1 hypothetical protein G4Z02_07050 [Xianfuyuplasma coldseepsis]
MEYVQKFIKVIESIEHDNTYKLAFARAILECIEAKEIEEVEDGIAIYQYNIVQKVMKYYWNLLDFFGLSQGPSSVLEARIQEIHDEFYGHTNVTYKVWYDKVESFLKRNPVRFERQVKKFITIFTKGVAAKFRVHRKEKLELFELDLQLKRLVFAPEAIASLQQHDGLVHQLIDYRWALLIEEYNKAPNVIRKVIGSKEDKIRRQNLIKYRNLLLQYDHLHGATDFFTNEHLDLDDISLEHLIPFHFIYGCDIWNLIIVSKETAKERRGITPTEADITRLEERNQRLFDAIKQTKLQARFDLENAIENHLLKRYYIDLKG